MNQETLMKAYAVCLIAGIAIPLVGVVLSGVGDLFDLDLDLDGDASFDAPVPVTPLTLSFGAVVFGAIGRLLDGRLETEPAFFAALLFGAAGAALIGRFVLRPLKRNRSLAQGIEDAAGQVGTVKLEARQDFVGTVTVTSATGSKVTYDARPVDGYEKLPIGTKVKVVKVDPQRRVCYVEPLEAPAGSAPGGPGTR